MIQAQAYAAKQAREALAPFSFERRDPRPNDVVIAIDYCGVCHSDIHQARDEWGGAIYPMVPGHEILGKVTAVGNAVKNFKVGDLAAVGCMVDSCRSCESCKEGLEQYCDEGATWTYNAMERDKKTISQGGYSSVIVTDESFVLRAPKNLDPAGVAPLLCAGITTYSPLRRWKVGPGMRVGVVGLGGLGHMGVKFARSFGAQVALFTTSESKREDGLRLGAHEVFVTRDPSVFEKQAKSFDFILDTVSASHPMDAYLGLLKRDGTLCLVGAPEQPIDVSAFTLILKRRSFAGSGIGGIRETQEMLDYCAEKNIVSDVEVIAMNKINEAYERVVKGDVKYRFVIDMKTLSQ
ncbi:MAG: NAD(P)-dependent alcohol dehydrogenase [Deltaproteobacteria bacterium]|nr:NAD(P)-dependent alcohol dehydrogenase [Deltaproteobacteria bacterium]